jgi:hypothetical protein
MSFVIGALTAIAPGATHAWWYDRGGGNYGTQLATANVTTANGTPLLAFDQWKRIDPSGYVAYGVSIKNIGSQWAWYNLQGGGVV